MLRSRRAVALLTTLTFLASVALAKLFAADPDVPSQAGQAAPPKVSTYAPIDDLANRVEFYKKRVESSLANEADFDDSVKKRVANDASTLAVLYLAVCNSDQDHELKKIASINVIAFLKLAKLSAHKGADLNTIRSVNKYTDDGPPPPERLAWAKVSDLAPLMEQSEVIFSALKSGITDDRRFKRSTADTAANAATLGAIGQEIVYDLPKDIKLEQQPDWRKFAAELRDASGAVNSAVHAGDQAQAKTALERLGKSCEACHAVFNKEGK